jgi:hypothetical protein
LVSPLGAKLHMQRESQQKLKAGRTSWFSRPSAFALFQFLLGFFSWHRRTLGLKLLGTQ